MPALACLLAVLLIPMIYAGPRMVSASRLIFHGNPPLAYTGKEVDPFTGVAFVSESWGRAEMTYSNGILHGPVTVVVRNRVFAKFSYIHGVKDLGKPLD